MQRLVYWHASERVNTKGRRIGKAVVVHAAALLIIGIQEEDARWLNCHIHCQVCSRPSVYPSPGVREPGRKGDIPDLDALRGHYFDHVIVSCWNGKIVTATGVRQSLSEIRTQVGRNNNESLPCTAGRVSDLTVELHLVRHRCGRGRGRRHGTRGKSRCRCWHGSGRRYRCLSWLRGCRRCRLGCWCRSRHWRGCRRCSWSRSRR